MTDEQSLKKYLICYGAENESWLCDAEDRDHAIEQFDAAELDGEVNHVFECVPILGRYFVRQRRAMWVSYIQEVTAVDESAAIDAFYNDFDPPHSFVEGAVQRVDHGAAEVFDVRKYPLVDDVFAAD
ncbi:MAG: hypothetical protein WCY29_10095 [Novosphingobium sp.]